LGYIDEEQEKAVGEFISFIHRVLVSSDIPDRIHEFDFAPQERGRWEEQWQSRTGFPLDELEKYWNSFQDWPRDESFHQGDVRNCDPKVTSEQRAEFEDFFQQYKNHRNETARQMHLTTASPT
jgi:hypothetical protein